MATLNQPRPSRAGLVPLRAGPVPPRAGFIPIRAGFTLIEMLAVLAIMIVMLSLSVVAFKDLGRGAGMRSGVLQFRTSLSYARQVAITQRARIVFSYSNIVDVAGNRGAFAMSKNGVRQGTETYLPVGITFTLPGQYGGQVPYITFEPDGTIDTSPSTFGTSTNSGLRSIRITDTGINGGTTALKVYPMTGRIRVVTGQP